MPSRVERKFEGRAEAVGQARAFVEAALAAWDLDDLAEVAVLLTSELTANVVRHARSSFHVAVIRDPAALTIEVRDGSAARPRRLAPSLRDEHGRGLQLVQVLADRWGSRPVSGGKVVWFRLRLPKGAVVGARPMY